MKTLKIFTTIFIIITIAEIFFVFIGILASSFFKWEQPILPSLDEQTIKNIRGFILLNLLASFLYTLLISPFINFKN